MTERKKVGKPVREDIPEPVETSKSTSARVEEIAQRLQAFEDRYDSMTRKLDEYTSGVRRELEGLTDKLNRFTLKWRDHFGGK